MSGEKWEVCPVLESQSFSCSGLRDTSWEGSPGNPDLAQEQRSLAQVRTKTTQK